MDNEKDKTSEPTLDDLIKQVGDMKISHETSLKEKDETISKLSKEIETLKKQSVLKVLGLNLGDKKKETDEDDEVVFEFN